METLKAKPVAENTKQELTSKFFAKVFGYLAIGLLITAAVAFGWSFYVAKFFSQGGELTETGLYLLIGTAIVAFVGSLIDSIVINIRSARSEKAPWAAFIVYAFFMGLVVSIFLLAGVDFQTMGEAFGLTALAFAIMFLIGYFSKSNLNVFAFIALGLLFTVFLVSAFFGIIYLINPRSALLIDYICSIVVVVAFMLIIGWDSWRIKKAAKALPNNNNLALYCAFTLYTDFITLFLRILYVLLMSKSSK